MLFQAFPKREGKLGDKKLKPDIMAWPVTPHGRAGQEDQEFSMFSETGF